MDPLCKFHAPVEDILFSLHHIAKANQLINYDQEVAHDLLTHFAKFAEEVIAPTNRIGDEQGADLVDGCVLLPEQFQTVYKALIDDGWQGLTAPEQFGGMQVNRAVAAGVSEVFSGANHSLQMLCNLVPGAITLLNSFGTENQKHTWIPKLASGNTLSTMCLTEPNAGSDLSAIRSRAVKTSGGWAITGEKIFISGGDQNLSDGILHIVLARSDDTDTGINGLSLFLVGKQKSVKIERLEKKMGLHASPTCHLRFTNTPAELIGKRGEGLKAMFTLMNHARIDVGLQGVAHATHAASIAYNYAQERRQGGQYLYQHPDVNRMLCEQKIQAITARALCHVALVAAEKYADPAYVEFMTSLCKVAGSEAGINAADNGIQVLGGYGYLEEYGLSQIWRDARITAIYEGSNGIHARTLVKRGLSSRGGAQAFAEHISELADNNTHVLKSIDSWKTLCTRIIESPEPLAHSRVFVNSTLALFEQACWIRIGQSAKHHSDSHMLQRLINFKSSTGELN